MEQQPLVSVVVITYNSSNTFIETLDSIKAQTYQNLELIISDDCSKDKTVEIVEEWLNDNKNHFAHVELVTTDVNTGVAGNNNRGIAKSHGTWIKPIAGDDLLLPECISNNLSYIKTNEEVQAVFSRALFFGDPFLCKKYENFGYGIFALSSRERYLTILTHNTIIAATAFISRKYIDSVGGYNEEIPFLEDWPFWIKMFKEKNKIVFINRETVKYRMGVSLSQGNGGRGKFDKSYELAVSYAYECQMQENPIYKIYAFLLKTQRKNKSLLYYWLLRINPYYYYYKYLGMKEKLASKRFNSYRNRLS